MSRLRGYKKKTRLLWRSSKNIFFLRVCCLCGRASFLAGRATSGPAFSLTILNASVLASQRRFLSLAATLQVFLDQLVYLLMWNKEKSGLMKRFSLGFRTTTKNCFPIVFTACYSFIIAQNHATYPGTLSALQAPNLKRWSANRGQNT